MTPAFLASRTLSPRRHTAPPPAAWRYATEGSVGTRSSPAVTGRRVTTSRRGSSRKACFHQPVLQRMEAVHGKPPPGAEHLRQPPQRVLHAFSSSFTAIRRAWNVRVAGSIGLRRLRGTQPRTSSARSWAVSIGEVWLRSTIFSGDPPAVPLLAIVEQEVG